MHTPAHKQSGIRDLTPAERSERTLHDYIVRKQESDSFFDKKKLTFEEWFNDYRPDEHQYDIAKAAWTAGQQNK